MIATYIYLQTVYYSSYPVHFPDRTVQTCTGTRVYCKRCNGVASEADCKADGTVLEECTQTTVCIQRIVVDVAFLKAYFVLDSVTHTIYFIKVNKQYLLDWRSH